MSNKYFVAVLALYLVGCSAGEPSQVAAGIGRGVMAVGSLGISELSYANAAKAKSANDAEDDAKCVEWGASKGSQAYLDCRIKLQTSRNAKPEIIQNSYSSRKTMTCNPYNSGVKCVEE